MEIDEQKQQELIMKFQIFEQQINAINQQLEAIESAIIEMGSLNLGLEELIGKKDNLGESELNFFYISLQNNDYPCETEHLLCYILDLNLVR